MLKAVDLYYFSPTGGTKRVGEIFCAELSENVKAINVAGACFNGTAEVEGDLVVVAAPVFGGRIPAVVTQRLKGMSGTGKKAVTLAVYGNRAYEDALLELNHVMEEVGFTVIGSAALVTRHSIVSEVAAGRPDETDIAEIREFAERILLKAAEHAGTKSCVQVPGNYPYKDSMKVSATPVSNEACNQCGACAAICPTGAIQVDGTEDNMEREKCILCMACVFGCPTNARSLPAPMQEAMNQKLGGLKDVRRKNEFFL